MEGDSDSKRPARKRPRGPDGDEESQQPPVPPDDPEEPLASTAGTTSGSTTTADADVDTDDVILERENTAWDVLEARFKQNAQDGNYFDLTDETAGDGGRALSVADAERAVEAMRRSSEHADEADASAANDGGSNNDGPVAAVAAAGEPPPAASSTNNEPRQSPIIRGLNNMIHDTITELQEAREALLAVMQGKRRPRSLQGLVLSIQRRTNRMQTYVNRHADEVMESTSIVERLEKMNLLVIKANALINAVNDKFFRSTSNSNRRNSRDRDGGGNGGSRGGNNEVIIID